MAALTLVTTPGAANANAYADIDDADEYHLAHVALDTWDAFSDEDQARALAMATRLLDQWFAWRGTVVGETQALLWPRVGAIGPNGYEEPSDAIPLRIEQGTAELARQLLVAHQAGTDRTADADIPVGIRRVKVEGLEVEFKDATGSMTLKTIPDAVTALVGVYGEKKSQGAGAVTVQRG